MGRGGHSDDEGTPYDQSLEEMDFLRSACSAAQKGMSSKLEAMLKRRPDLVKSDGGDNRSGYTPLHYASREGHLDCVKLLLDTGADVNGTTKAGNATSLQRAAYTGKTEVVRFLLQRGANAMLQDSDGETALHKASTNGHVDTTRALLDACPGACLICDRKQKTPAECATGEVRALFEADS
ncbi:hypothetical protein CYMTET_50081 [Cymbomonas tetramitiformis]|uniref:Uncharacterized protein n=1 Tax=Cymbomonas tetramitiformis TaxID=36881 RepID=A0AAE0BQ38_9CHLO|nr:hypothetical protein CYMTET_50081 [Cymbomonas tetramitiformis]